MRRVTLAMALAACGVISACAEATYPEIESGADAVELQKVVDSMRAELGIPGAVVAVRVSGGSDFLLTSGVDNVVTKAPMNSVNRFRIGSITKTMVATVALQLVDEGSISLADTISRWIPNSVASANRITVRMLLNHTSGVPDYLDDAALLASIRANPARIFAPAEAIAAANRQTRQFEPGAANGWAYSNTNYVLLGLVIEAVTGLSIDQVLQRRIFDRLGMTSTYFATTTAAPSPFSRGYANVDGTGDIDVTTVLSPTFAGAAGAVVSNARDLLVWSQALAEGTLVSAARHLDQITSVPASSNEAYGLGVQKAGAWVGHSGEIAGYEASMFTRPGVGTIIVLVNKSLGSGSDSYAILDRVRWAEFGTR